MDGLIERIETPRMGLTNEQLQEITKLTGYDGFVGDGNLFLRSLIEIGVTPFDPKAVKLYQTLKLSELNKGKIFRSRQFEWHQFMLGPRSATGLYGDPLYYNEAIPMNVLELMVKIKKALPECGFRIDAIRKYQAPVYMDPFLVVSQYDGETKHKSIGFQIGQIYHVAVWDEPTFNDIALEQ